MNFEVLTLFPHSLEPIFESSIIGRAMAKGVISVKCTDIRDYTLDKHRRVDDAPYGGGYGMVMMCQPVVDCIRSVKAKLSGSTRVIYMSPQGSLFDQKKAEVIFALENGVEVGFALFFHNFSTFLGRAGIYLEDLFVKPEFRGKGYGKSLLKKLAQIAVERGCGRLEWWCLDWNKPSIDFYLSLGAEPMNEWTTYRIAGDTLKQLAE